SKHPVGISCKVTSLLKKTSAKEGYAEIRVPIQSFDSGEPDRDKTVVEILHADKQPDLILRTKTLPLSELEGLWSKKSCTVDGEMEMGGKKFALTIPFETTQEAQTAVLRGKIETTFTAFGLNPPAIAGGLVAQVKDELELHYQLRRDQFS